MNAVDLLIEIRKSMIAQVCNYGLKSVFTEDQWREFVYKCLCAGVTDSQIKQLEELGIDKKKIYDILNIGKDCGICIKGECNVSKCKKGKTKNGKCS